MRAFVDPDICIGCGLCNSLCPDVFTMNEDGYAESCEDVTDENADSVQEAVDSCPVSAIDYDK